MGINSCSDIFEKDVEFFLVKKPRKVNNLFMITFTSLLAKLFTKIEKSKITAIKTIKQK